MQEGAFAPMTNETSAQPCTQEKQEETHILIPRSRCAVAQGRGEGLCGPMACMVLLRLYFERICHCEVLH